jgi:hypothetical protein
VSLIRASRTGTNRAVNGIGLNRLTAFDVLSPPLPQTDKDAAHGHESTTVSSLLNPFFLCRATSGLERKHAKKPPQAAVVLGLL